MQLKRKFSVRNQLTIATSALLISTFTPDANAALGADMQATDTIKSPKNSKKLNTKIVNDSDSFAISSLYYAEEGRVKVNKMQTLISNQLDDNNLLKTNFIYDTMTGSSPNGRKYIPNTSGLVTVTTASGNSFNTEGSAANPAAATWLTAFADQRLAGSVEWDHSLTSILTTTLGSSVSSENDYTSYSGTGKVLLELNQKRTAFTFGSSFTQDTIRPIGGIPQSLGVLTCSDDASARAFAPAWLNCDSTINSTTKSREKSINDYFIGVTQVWNQHTIFQLNYSQGKENGYLTDPYKQASIIDKEFNDEVEIAILHEKRPDTRNTQSVFFRLVNAPTDSLSINMSYRYFWDDWEIESNTFDVRFRFNLNNHFYIQTHARYNTQTSAFFFSPYIDVTDKESDNFSAPKFFSADHRLGDQTTTTGGIKLGRNLGDVGKVGLRIEQMRQRYTNNQIPNMKAWIIQMLLSFKF